MGGPLLGCSGVARPNEEGERPEAFLSNRNTMKSGREHRETKLSGLSAKGKQPKLTETILAWISLWMSFQMSGGCQWAKTSSSPSEQGDSQIFGADIHGSLVRTSMSSLLHTKAAFLKCSRLHSVCGVF